jgi:microcystin-dependent protein
VDTAGNPLPSGSYDVVFRIWKNANPSDPADALVWGQTNSVTVVNGIFNVVLGGGSGIVQSARTSNLPDAFAEPQRFLSLTIARNPSGAVASPAELLPRQQILNAPYALRAYHGIPAGSVLPFAGAYAPGGFLLCDGRAVSRSTYSGLYSAIGTAWGTGDGVSTFNVPDLRGSFLRGVDGGAGRDPDKASRTATAPGGNTGNNVGSLQRDQFAAHDHGGGNHRHQLHGDIWGDALASTRFLLIANAGNNRDFGDTTARDADTIELSGNIISPNGGAETRPMNHYVTYIIKY